MRCRSGRRPPHHRNLQQRFKRGGRLKVQGNGSSRFAAASSPLPYAEGETHSLSMESEVGRKARERRRIHTYQNQAVAITCIDDNVSTDIAGTRGHGREIGKLRI